jgi:uncharacterized protein YbaR (Trm112 family)
MVELDRDWVAMLICPETHAPVVQVGDWLYSTDAATRKRYPIRDGIPVMLADEAETVDEATWRETLAQAERVKSDSTER